MNDQELINYIQQQMSQGISKEIITNTLISSGWQKINIDQAFNALSIASSQPQTFVNTQTNIITEKDYPITKLWIFKAPIIFLAISIPFIRGSKISTKTKSGFSFFAISAIYFTVSSTFILLKSKI